MFNKLGNRLLLWAVQHNSSFLVKVADIMGASLNRSYNIHNSLEGSLLDWAGRNEKFDAAYALIECGARGGKTEELRSIRSEIEDGVLEKHLGRKDAKTAIRLADTGSILDAAACMIAHGNKTQARRGLEAAFELATKYHVNPSSVPMVSKQQILNATQKGFNNQKRLVVAGLYR